MNSLIFYFRDHISTFLNTNSKQKMVDDTMQLFRNNGFVIFSEWHFGNNIWDVRVDYEKYETWIEFKNNELFVNSKKNKKILSYNAKFNFIPQDQSDMQEILNILNEKTLWV